MIGCAIVLIAMVISVYFDESMKLRIDQNSQLAEEYDKNNCTAADYTVRINIPANWYRKQVQLNDWISAYVGVVPAEQRTIATFNCLRDKLTKELEKDLTSPEKQPALLSTYKEDLEKKAEKKRVYDAEQKQKNAEKEAREDDEESSDYYSDDDQYLEAASSYGDEYGGSYDDSDYSGGDEEAEVEVEEANDED